jgi:hypothetical protein
MNGLFDVISVRINKPHEVGVLERGKSEDDADRLKNYLGTRYAIEDKFLAVVPNGRYDTGDHYRGSGL